MLRYDDLPDGDAVGVFGASDALGTLNRLTLDVVRAAAAEIVDGEVFSLNAPVDWVTPPLFGREQVRHEVFRTRLGNLDDRLDAFFPQASSQWDHFLHIADPDLGHYNRITLEGAGIHDWAARGIAGRAVVADAAAWLTAQGADLVWDEPFPILPEHLGAMLDAAGVELREGDILLVRTGWESGYRAADPERRARAAGARSPGLAGGTDMLRFLWDWGVAAVATDGPAFESWPIEGLFLHPQLLGRLGIPIGELWWLDALAERCRADGRYTSFLTSAPLHVPGGIGSPANALAIR